MESASAVEFAQAARQLGRAARRQGIEVPSFRCPPRVVGADRTIRYRPSGAVVSVRVADRPMAAVLADMIEGIVVANRLVTPASDRVRSQLWSEVSSPVHLASNVTPLPTRVVPGAA